ncbi:hypothetical protein ABEF95_002449 [Exophiala dermatitidis]
MPPPASLEAYRVGWICALHTDMLAARAMLDEDHGMIRGHGQDANTYAVGRIHDHNVVIAGLPAGIDGPVSAASVVKDMTRAFHDLRFMLLVGIGGGIPNLPINDIRLGDVVVSQPSGTTGGVIQFNRGKNFHGGQFERKGSVNAPSNVLLTALTAQKAEHQLHGSRQMNAFLNDMINRHPNLKNDFAYPGSASDRFFRPDYVHPKNQPNCLACNPAGEVPRPQRGTTTPQVHYGLIASGDQVVKDPGVRDFLRSKYGALCVEMEAAGLMHNFPGLVIKGICDYADSHRGDTWHKYAAATAAACTKELLHYVSSAKVDNESPIHQIMGENGNFVAD